MGLIQILGLFKQMISSCTFSNVYCSGFHTSTFKLVCGSNKECSQPGLSFSRMVLLMNELLHQKPCISLRIGTILIGLLNLLFDFVMAGTYISAMFNSGVFQEVHVILWYNVGQVDPLAIFYSEGHEYLVTSVGGQHANLTEVTPGIDMISNWMMISNIQRQEYQIV